MPVLECRHLHRLGSGIKDLTLWNTEHSRLFLIGDIKNTYRQEL